MIIEVKINNILVKIDIEDNDLYLNLQGECYFTCKTNRIASDFQ